MEIETRLSHSALMDKSRADEAGVVGVGEVGVMAMEKCAGLSLEFGKL